MAHDEVPTGPDEHHERVEQLPLLDVARPDWKLDEHTRELGRRGVQLARAALTNHSRHAA